MLEIYKKLKLNNEYISSLFYEIDTTDVLYDIKVVELYLLQCIIQHKQQCRLYYDTDYDNIKLNYDVVNDIVNDDINDIVNNYKDYECIELLLNSDNEDIKSKLLSWDKGDCSLIGLVEILLYQLIGDFVNKNGTHIYLNNIRTRFDKCIADYITESKFIEVSHKDNNFIDCDYWTKFKSMSYSNKYKKIKNNQFNSIDANNFRYCHKNYEIVGTTYETDVERIIINLK